MNIRLIGDVHFGKRFPYTTLKTAITFDQNRELLFNRLTLNESVIQLGDLFDEFSVNDLTLVQGYQAANRCVSLLPGNHDLSKNTDKDSALLLLQKHFGCGVVNEMYGTVTQGMTEFFLLPHQHTQPLFEERLKFLCDLIQKKESKARFNVLCLHCNFGAHTGPEADNYLSPAMAKELLAAGFHLIVSGHEHNFRNPMPGVVMLGSILPMSFGEMEQKYVMDYDTQAGTYDLTPSWSTSGYCRVSWGELLAEECSTWNNYQFLEIVGDLEVDNAVKVNRQVSAILRSCDNIIAVKNNTVLHKQSHKIDEASKANWMDTLMAACATDDQRDAIVALRAEVSRGKKKYAETE